jgi:SynChlorMet cassette radical SAM/SPASM protein ScmF
MKLSDDGKAMKKKEQHRGSRPFPLKSIYFYLTEGCNLRCRHCMVGAKFQTAAIRHPTLMPDLFHHILRQAKPLGLFSIKLGGGEPLLHPRFGEFLEIVRSENIGLNVETNGVLCTPALASDLARCRLINISVSLDGSDAGAHEWMRGVEGCYEGAIRGIRNLVSAGIRPQIIMSVVGRNAHQMEALVGLAESLGAASVQFNPVRPLARGERMQANGELLSIRDMVKKGEWVETDLSRRAKIPVFITHPLAFRPFERVYGQGGSGSVGCGIREILGVLADGSYALCGIGGEVPELAFGHASRDVLEDVWLQAPLLKELREGLPHRFRGICGKCLLKGICLGHCVAQNYYKSRDFWTPYWFCEEADKEGLFPESRKQPRSGLKKMVV